VLSGPIPDRALAAADLYHQGLSLLVFLTRGYRSPSFRYTGEGVPPSD